MTNTTPTSSVDIVSLLQSLSGNNKVFLQLLSVLVPFLPAIGKLFQEGGVIALQNLILNLESKNYGDTYLALAKDQSESERIQTILNAAKLWEVLEQTERKLGKDALDILLKIAISLGALVLSSGSVIGL